QADPAERGQQVSIMGSIYMTAEDTIAWLGEEVADQNGNNYTDDLIHVISSLRLLPLDETGSIRNTWLESNLALSLDPEISTDKDKWFRAIQLVLELPWFRRAWVFQEAVLSRSVMLFLGNHFLRLQELADLVDAVDDVVFEMG